MSVQQTAPWADYRSVERLIHWTAHRVMRRVRAAQIDGYDLEDITGELNIAWCKARDRFDPNQGVPFSTYLRNGMYHHINRVIANLIQERHLSLDADTDDSDGDKASSHHDEISDDAESADAMVERKSQVAYVMSRLSPDARRFLELMTNPPREVLDNVKANQAKALFARSRGMSFQAPRDVNSALIFDLMGLNVRERHMVLTEIQQLSQMVNR